MFSPGVWDADVRVDLLYPSMEIDAPGVNVIKLFIRKLPIFVIS